MKKSLIIILLFFATYCVCNSSVVAQKINGSIDEKTVILGRTAHGKIILTIPSGLHINSNKPADEFLVPTTVKFSSSNVKIGKIIYPKAKLKKFKFSEEPLSVYEGKIAINFTFSIPSKFESKQVKIDAAIKYQACTEQVCFPPKKEKLLLFAKIK